MAAVSPSIEARARKNFASLLHSMSKLKQVTIAERLNVDESTVSRMKEAEIERIANFVAACGLKVVPEDQECYGAGYLDSLRKLLSVELSRTVPTSGFGALGD